MSRKAMKGVERVAMRARANPWSRTMRLRLTTFSTHAMRRHVVLPPDIAKMLPKGRLLSEVRARSLARAR